MLSLIDLELSFRNSVTQPLVMASMRDQRSSAFSELGSAEVQFDLAELLALSSDALAYGQALARMLFTASALRDAWNTAQGYAAGAGSATQLRLRLRFENGAELLQAVRWECLCDPAIRPVIADGRVLLLRYVPSADLHRVQAATRENLRILAAVASPHNSAQFGLAPFDAAAEVVRLRAALGDMPHLRIFASDAPEGRATPERLAAALQDGCDLLYIVCHGALVDGEAVLWLEDLHGSAVPLTTAAITRILGSLPANRRPLLVVFGACHSAGRNDPADVLSALAPRLTQDGVPAVLAMQGYAPVSLIERFLPAVLRELLRSGQIDEAVAIARSTVPHEQAWLPALYLRSQDGRLWNDSPISSPEPPSSVTLRYPLTIALFADRADQQMSALRTALGLRGVRCTPSDDDDDEAPLEALAGAAAALVQLTPEFLDHDDTSELVQQLSEQCRHNPAFTLYTILNGVTERAVSRVGLDLKALKAIMLPNDGDLVNHAGRIYKRIAERTASQWATTSPLDVGLYTFPPAGQGAVAPLCLDWQQWYQQGAYPSPMQWQAQLLPALQDAYAVLRGRTQLIRLHVNARNSVACAFGHQFRSVSNIRLLIPQRDDEWETRPYEPWAEALKQNPETTFQPLQCAIYECDPDATDFTVELPLTQQRVTDDVTYWMEQHQPSIRRRLILQPPADTPLQYNADTMHAVACQVRHAILDQRRDPRLVQGTAHLFGAIPAALAVLIGWQLNTCEPVQCYELEGNATLRPACLLRR
jgi:hypothetical protein